MRAILGGVRWTAPQRGVWTLTDPEVERQPPVPDADSAAADDPDLALVRAIAEGDQEACRTLVDRHLPRMLGLARRMLGNPHEAEDVAQEVFLRVWTHASRWRPEGARFETWLHRVAINLCYDRLRRKREVLVDEMPEEADPAPNAETLYHEAHVASRVEAAIASLPDRQKTAILLCHQQGMTNIEAAAALDVSIEALESLLARGRRRLKEILSAEAGDLLGGV
ncbi:MAG: RNA polymerase sigma factor [Alphaproteobacteria bacterium]|nr:RNA polymerase sigma factor [Alphaproteobacteria bacterium]